MKSSREILFVGRRIIEQAIRQEAIAQGHYLTGDMERSMTATVTESAKQTTVEGEMAGYAQILNEGFAASSASMRQFPFLVKFWMLRGLPEERAKRAAAATIKKWMREGMPTASSATHAKEGQRRRMLDNALTKALPEADQAVMKGFSDEIDKVFQMVKSETV